MRTAVMLLSLAACTPAAKTDDANDLSADATDTELVDTDSNTVIGDYIAPNGRQPGATSEHPGAARLLTARSNNGLTWTRTNEIVSDQANVPDMVIDTKGTIFLYFTGGVVGDRENVTALAKSTDDGENWTF